MDWEAFIASNEIDDAHWAESMVERMAEKAKMKVLYHIKKEDRNGEEKTFFNRVGRGFVNKDGSINLWLESLPVGVTEETTFNLRDYVPKEKKEADGFSE